MLLMVWLRTQFTPQDVSTAGLIKLRHPVYTVEQSETHGILSPLQSSKELEAFFLYSNYTDIYGYGYDVLYDIQSPLYFYPLNCGERGTFSLGGVTNIIAFVGQNSTVAVKVQNYIKQVFLAQNLTSAGLQPKFQYFQTQQDLFDYISSKEYLNPNEGVCFGFEVTMSGVDDYSVNLYFDDQHDYGGGSSAGVPTQSQVWSHQTNTPQLKAYEEYALDGFLWVQNIIANMVLKEVSGQSGASISLLTVPMPAQNAQIDAFQAFNVPFANLVLVMFMLPVYNLVFYIVKEKESRTKESMRMMGLGDAPYWLSWFVYYTLLNTAISLIAWFTIMINLFQNTPQIYIFLAIWGYGMSLAGEILVIQAFLTRSKYAGIIATVIYFLLDFTNILPLVTKLSSGAQIGLSFVPQFALFRIIIAIFEYEALGVGLRPSNMWQQNKRYITGVGYSFYLIDFVVWILLGLYLEAVLPTEYGEQKHPLFLCQRSTYTSATESDEEEPQSPNDTLELKKLLPDNYEPAPADIVEQENQNDFMRIENLQKTYPNGFQAVKGLNLKIYQNQIFALLGQNGAGKSTTISMLTGLISKSAGSARVFGINMFKNRKDVRQIMGVCPQHDVLFDYLNAHEHLSIFFDLKGGDPAKKQQEILDLIRDVGLEEDQHKPAGSLSGGNRRKLSVAIAMCGGSKLVLLDEPTAGMDLGARRSLWDMLKNYRNDRIIILTTHYMDEADVLGDRIGIMAKGQMKCLGSSLFLKRRFGAGYKLTMVKGSKEPNTKIQTYIESHVGPAELLSEVSSEIAFGLPEDVEDKFTHFFTKLDEDMDSLGIISYGVSITTLEEVFIHINSEFGLDLKKTVEDINAHKEEGPEQNQPDIKIQIETEDSAYASPKVEISEVPIIDPAHLLNGSEVESSGGAGGAINSSLQKAKFSKITTDVESGGSLFESQQATERLISESSFSDNFKALATKRILLYKRDWAGIVCEVFVPFIMVMTGCILTKIYIPHQPQSVALTVEKFPTPQPILMNNQTISNLSDVTPQTLFANLPGSFDVQYIQADNFTQFYDQIYSDRGWALSGNWQFGSYEVYRADNQSMQYQVNTYVNLTSQGATAYFPQFMYQSILTTASGNPDFNFEVTSVPFPLINALEKRRQQGNTFVFNFMIAIGLSLIPCAMISFILKEREENLKHMQLISGMSLPAYWVSNMVADIIKVYVPLILIMLLMLVFNMHYDGVWALFLLFPLAIVPFTYCTSFMFDNNTSGQIMTLLLNLVICIILANTVYVLQLIPETFALGDKLRYWLCIFPSYCVMNGIWWASEGSQLIAARNGQNVKELNPDLWSFQNLGGDALFLILHFFIDSAILFLIESKACSCLKKYFQKPLPDLDQQIVYDSDVKNEEERIKNLDGEVVKVYGFRKQYQKFLQKPFLAVENISFGLQVGECFALLGVNGAGKTTTFKSLTACVEPSSGEIKISGYDTISQFNEARKLIGYCPQHDAIFPLLTVEEHLKFYVNLKGIKAELREELIEHSIKQFNLADHRNKQAGSLSGGNKRKLSVAIAVLGNPPIILLDEPSAGMDPEARRFMWQAVANISQRDKQSAVIITTHSMEEAEALSTKMGIMVRGGIFRCYGSAQHIKSKYGTGFELEVKIVKATPSTLFNLAREFDLPLDLDQKADLFEIFGKIQHRVPTLIFEQIKPSGLGSVLALESQENGDSKVRLKNLLSYIHTLRAGLSVIEFMCEHFSEVELYEQCSDFFKMRIPNMQDKTIGFVFGIVQANKARLAVTEYSVQQTSLEQIFQSFAQTSAKAKSSFLFKKVEGKGVVILDDASRRSIAID